MWLEAFLKATVRRMGEKEIDSLKFPKQVHNTIYILRVSSDSIVIKKVILGSVMQRFRKKFGSFYYGSYVFQDSTLSPPPPTELQTITLVLDISMRQDNVELRSCQKLIHEIL